jgi:hypothetical protein
VELVVLVVVVETQSLLVERVQLIKVSMVLAVLVLVTLVLVVVLE